MNQSRMFANGEDSPIFTQTPVRVEDTAFIPEARVGVQAGFFVCGVCRDTGIVDNKPCWCGAGKQLNDELAQDLAQPLRVIVVLDVDDGEIRPVYVPEGVELVVYDTVRAVRVPETYTELDNTDELPDMLGLSDGSFNDDETEFDTFDTEDANA